MLAIIGCGNTNRSDDGVGVVVAHRLRALLDRLPRQARMPVRILDAGTDGMAVMFEARGAQSLIIVDASTSGAEAGAIFEVPGHALEAPPRESYNLHDFRWDHALYAGRRIYGEAFPCDVMVYLVEAASLELGLTLSPPVAAAADRVVDKIMARIAGRTEAGHADATTDDGDASPASRNGGHRSKSRVP